MLDQQEKDRVNEMKKREGRAQDFMNKMADNVLQKMELKQRQEEQMLAKYENEKEMYTRKMEEKRALRLKNEQEKMRYFLAQQMAEKKAREDDDKANIDQQARMWEQDKTNYDEEERRLKQRISKINKDNADYLLKQADKKNQTNARMNPNEFALNRPLLREANQKLKGMSQHDGSASVQSGMN